jgi:thymidine phosphorylase
MQLRKLFEYVADRLGLHLEVIISNGRQPVGRGIGPVLEARDVMQVLAADPAAPPDLRDKALRLAGRIIEFDPDVRGGYGYRIAREILESGRALAQMNRIIDAQGRRSQVLAPGALTLDITASEAGLVTAIDNLQLAKIARLAGAPLDKSAGVDLFCKIGDSIVSGQPLYRIHAEHPAAFKFAQQTAQENDGYRLGDTAELPQVFAEF